MAFRLALRTGSATASPIPTMRRVLATVLAR